MPHNPKVRTAATTRIAPALPRRAPSRFDRLSFFLSMAVSRREFFAQSQRRQLKSTNTNTTTLMFSLKVERHVDITTDTYPIDSRARGVGWVAWFALALRERARLGGKCQKAPWCCGALVMKLRSSCPPICARPAGPSRCFVRCRGTTHHQRQVRHISWLLSRKRPGFPSEAGPANNSTKTSSQRTQISNVPESAIKKHPRQRKMWLPNGVSPPLSGGMALQHARQDRKSVV